MRIIEKKEVFDDAEDGQTVESHAFMSCLWADGDDWRAKLSKYVHDAVVLGYTLYKHCRNIRRVLLVSANLMDRDEVKFLDQFSTRNPMVPFPRAHSNAISIFGNQTHHSTYVGHALLSQL